MCKWAKSWVNKIEWAKLLPYRNRCAEETSGQETVYKDVVPDKVSPMKSHFLLCPSLPNVHSTTKPSMDWFMKLQSGWCRYFLTLLHWGPSIQHLKLCRTFQVQTVASLFKSMTISNLALSGPTLIMLLKISMGGFQGSRNLWIET